MSQLIPDSLIQDVLAKTDIVELVGRHVELKKSGRNYSACCPFHEEKTPSFSVNPKKQTYTCFGCGENGNAINFVRTRECLSFPAAVRALAKEVGVEIPDRELTKKDKAEFEKVGKLQQVASYAAKRYFKTNTHPNAQKYTQARGLSRDSIVNFGIGYAPDSFDFVTGRTRDQWKELNIELGLIAESSKSAGKFFDFFRNRLIFPIRNEKGQTVGFGGRALDNNVKPKYLNTPESDIFKKSETLYGLYEALQANQFFENIIVTEGYMDVVSMASANITNTVATMGTALTEGHCSKIFKHTDTATFVFDGDKAGYQAAVKAATVVAPFLFDGRSAKFVMLSEGVDPDSLIREGRAEELNALLANAMCFTDFLIQHAQSVSGDQSDIANRAKACGLLKAIMVEMPDSFLRELFVSKVAQVMGLDSSVVRRLTIDDKPQQVASQGSGNNVHQLPVSNAVA